MNVSIDGFVQEMLIDSGSVSNLMGEEDFFKLKGLGLMERLKIAQRNCLLTEESKLM